MPVIVSSLTPILDSFISSYIYMGILIVISLWTNNFRFNSNTLLGYLILLICILVNIFISEIKQFVIPDAINLLIYSFVPIYLLTLRRIDMKYLVDKSLQFATYLAIALPYFYYLRQNGFINYFELGIVCHFIIILVLIDMMIKKTNIYLSYILLGLGSIIGLIYGSRTVVLASVACYIVSLFFNSEKNKLKYNLFVMSILGLLIFLVSNLKTIVETLALQLASAGINSRNIVLLANMLESGSLDQVSSGREDIYPVVINYILNHPLAPSGFGVSRVLTNGAFYHSHNFLLEIFLILGVPLGLFFLSWIILKIFKLYYQNIRITFTVVIILFVSFFVRGIFGTHLVSDQVFLLVIGFLVSDNSFENNKVKGELK